MNTLITVVTLVGEAWALASGGARRELQAGDRLLASETLIVEPGAQVDVDFGDNQVISFVGEQSMPVEDFSELVAQVSVPQSPQSPQPIESLTAEAGTAARSEPTADVPVTLQGSKFIQLVRIAEIIESDGLSPLAVARIEETLRPLDMGYPAYPRDIDDWREHRGGDEHGEGLRARRPGVDVELQGAGEDGIYNAAEIGSDGTVSALVTLDDQVRAGDKLVVTDGDDNVLLERMVTEQDLLDGVVVEVPVAVGQTDVVVKATVSVDNGNSASSDDNKPIDNLAPEPLVSEREDADTDVIDLELDSYFSDSSPISYEVQGLPPGLSFDPQSGRITGTLDNSASQGGDGSDGRYTVTIVATDSAGNATTHELAWTVTNPAPTAADDTNSIAEDGPATAGNVITGEGADNGSAAADSDPDGDDLLVVGVEAGASGSDPVGNVGTTVTGQYGELVLNADGSYSYVLDNDNPLVNALKDGDTLTEVFTYRISDGEGGEDTATLTITINGNTDGAPGVSVSDLNGAEVGDNSIAEDATTPVTGTFTVTAPDGLKQISVGGITVTAEQLDNLGTTPVNITGSEGQLTLTGFNETTGEVTYRYQQSGTAKDHNAGDDSVTDSFPIIVTDNADESTAPSDLVILITDTAPVANADTNSVDEDSGTPATGNVISDTGSGEDDIGADTTTVTGVASGTASGELTGAVGGNVVGSYGTLVLGSDGEYSYVLDDSNADVNALKDGDSLTDTFSYTIKDADGDWSTTTLTITINGNTDGAPGVSVSDLNGAEVGDNSIAEDATTPVTGTFTVTAPDGLKQISVGGITVTAEQLDNLGTTPVNITGSEGQLTLTGFNETTGEVTYRYQQSGTAKDHNAGDDSVTDSFPIIVTDNADESTAPSDLVILITDTAPVANADTNSVDEDSGTPATGNVISDTGSGEDDIGADTTTVTGVTTGTASGELTGAVGGNVVGSYGTLVLGSDGEYSYVLDDTNADVNALKDGDSLTDSFSYTIKDADGDWSTTTLTITINGNTDGAPGVSVNDLNGAEVGDNSIAEDATTPVTGTFTVTAPDGLKQISVGGITVTAEQLDNLGTTPVNITGSEGQLTLTGFNETTGEVTYRYQQSGTAKDHNAGDDSVTDSFPIIVTDNADESTAPSDLVILITDTAPVANADTNSVDEDSGTPATGNVISDTGSGEDDIGADTTTVTGVASGTASGELTGAVGGNVVGSYGTLVLGSDGEYSYVLDDSNADVNALKDGDSLTDTFSYTIKDADGDWSTTTLTITINGNTDGAPGVSVNDLNGAEVGDNSIAEDATTPVTGTFTVTAPDGLKQISVGGITVTAEQLDNLGTTPVNITGSEGQLTLTGFNETTGEVTYRYQQSGTAKDHNAGDDSVTDSFPIIVTDNADESTAPSDLVILITDTAPVANADTNSVDEDSGTPATGNVISDTGSGEDDIGADTTTVTGVASGTASGELTGAVGGNVVGSYGTLVLGSDGEYSYVLDDSNADVNALKDGDSLTDTFSYTIKDADGDWSTTTLTITINGNTDGAPLLTPNDGNGSGTGIEAAGDATVYESGLTTDGPGMQSATVAGSIQLNTADGLASVTLGDGANAVTLTLAQLQSLGTTPQQITTPYGTLTLTGLSATDSVGGVPTAAELQYSYTLDRPYDNEQAGEDDNAIDAIAAVVTDAGGASHTDQLQINIVDDAPSVGTAENASVTEAGLAGGSREGEGGAPTSVSGDLDVRVGADNTAGSGVADVTFAANQSTLEALRLSAGYDGSGDPVMLQYVISADGHTLTAFSGDGRSAGDQVFVVSINDSSSSDASYTFTLNRPLNHGGATSLNLPFAYDVVDGDGDNDNGDFVITVEDDAPVTSKSITVGEDSLAGNAANTFNTSADANPENTTVYDVNGVPLTATTNGDGSVSYSYPAGTDVADKHFFGTVTVNSNGSITFVPEPNYSNHDGADSFRYETVNGSDIASVTVTVNVTPVADAPQLSTDAATVTTSEDVAVALGLNAPAVVDSGDQNGAGVAGDNPELLGVITLSGIPAGAVLLDASNGDASLYESTGDAITIVISDGTHISGITGNTLTLTQQQFEALKVLPPEDAHENFTAEMRVTSYEVDNTGTPIPGVAGAESSTSVVVDVAAVTDPVSLSFTDNTDTRSLSINEDGTYDLAAELKVEYPDNDGNSLPDVDGSEERWFEIAGLPEGSTVTTADGVIVVTAANPVVTVPASGLSTSAAGLPKMGITPPADYSGAAVAVTVTLKSQDRDDDSAGVAPVVEQDSVTLNLQVDPVADAPDVEGVTTPEDTAVNFLANVSPGDTDGSEELTGITIKDIPDGWVIEDHEGNPLTPSGGQLVIDPADVLSGDYKSYTIKAPDHSSLDTTLTLDISVRDNSNDGAVGPANQTFTDIQLEVQVTPVAETVDTDSNDAGGNDVTLTPGHDYVTPGAEDTWFSLGQEPGFNLADNWSNEDSVSEKMFALLTPELVVGDGSNTDAIGSSFRYSTDGGTTWVTQVYGGDPIEVPVEYLNTLQFKAAPDFSGSFSIDVQAVTRDYDEDDLAGRNVDELSPAELAALSYNEAVSGNAVLTNVFIAPVADTATTTVSAHVRGLEDEAMPLSIRPSSSDPSETFNVTISAIPDGTTLVYDGITLTQDATGLPAGFSIVSTGDGSWSVVIDDFDPAKGGAMTITAPPNSNEPFTLTVDTVSVDTLTIPGDPNSPYVSESSAYQLDILVSPKGVADSAELTIVDPADQSFQEADVDANGGVPLNQLVTGASLTDSDGSEVLSFKVSNLPAGFTLIGGTLIGDGVWSLTEAQLQTAVLVTPPNFNGTASFDLYAVTTENDGDSLTDPHVVSVRVEPSPEASINLTASIDEDVSTALSFGIQHQNGDTDEQLDAVWLSVLDVDGATDFTLTYGSGGVSLAQAVSDGLPGITLEDGWYKLSGDALNSIHAQGRENWSGSAEIDVRYLITDPAADGTVSDVQSATDGSYSITVNPITDQPVLTVTSGADSSLAAPANVVVELNIANQGGDYDGSEQLNRILLDNVPDGVIVENGEYLGNGQWMLVPETAFNSQLTPSVTLRVQARAGGLDDHQITVTVITEDANNGQQLSDSTSVSLSTTFAEGEPAQPAEILQWEQSAFEPTEDTAFSLGEGINASIEDGVTDNGFTVTLTDLPAGTTVSGMRLTVIDGQEVWTASGVGGDAELQTLLDNIVVTPPADWNKHDGDFVYDAKLTTYVPSGGRAEAAITMQQSVIPVTDDADVLISAPAVAEGNDVEISIDLSNPADDPNWTLIDGNIYLTLDEPTAMQGGVLQDSSGNPLTLTSVTGVSGVPDGSYYVIDVAAGGNSVDLRYTPVDQHVSGSINLSVISRGQELDSSVVKTTTTTATATVEPVNSGYDFSVADTTGAENTFGQVTANKSNVIQLNVTDGGLVDADGSEAVGTILLSGLPNGFLVYVGDSAADATLASLGSNAGSAGDGTNTWLLGEGELPAFIGILPPAHWSGTLEQLRLIVNSQESSLSEITATEQGFSLTVEAVAEGLALTPTPSFGNEGEIIQLNLNAEMRDIEQVDATDASIETINLQFKGMGEHAAFYLDGVLISGTESVSYADGVYTLEGLTQDEVSRLGFVQSVDALGEVQVRAQTVESENGDTSAWTHEESAAWAEITTNITPQYGTAGDDQLLWTGSLINGRGGDDTIQLRFDESVTGSELSGSARNIEAIDLTGNGENSIASLSAEDVFDMTDARNTLRIDGDGAGVDSVELNTSSGWTLDAGASVAGYDVYTATVSSQTVVLEVAQGVLVE